MKTNIQQTAILTICCMFCFVSLKAQNLVPNGSMEVYVDCPVWPETSYVAPWGYYNTPDYFHTCSDSASPIDNIFGWQFPFSGSAFIRSISSTV